MRLGGGGLPGVLNGARSLESSRTGNSASKDQTEDQQTLVAALSGLLLLLGVALSSLNGGLLSLLQGLLIAGDLSGNGLNLGGNLSVRELVCNGACNVGSLNAGGGYSVFNGGGDVVDGVLNLVSQGGLNLLQLLGAVLSNRLGCLSDVLTLLLSSLLQR